MGDHEDTLVELMSITGADHAEALTILEATEFNLSAAIDLYFAKSEGGGAFGGATGDDERISIFDDEEVRAPIPIKRERLFGDYASMPSRPAAAQQVKDAFRDFQAENAAGLDGGSSTQGLAKMFEPPKDLLFVPVGGGGLEEAKAAAMQSGKWLMVNVQCNEEFASYQLNRDTWSNQGLQDIIKGTFVFYQVQKASDAGTRVAAAYRLEELPAVLVVDPVTGAKVRAWTGFLDPERMVEDLVPFMDHSFDDAAAATLATSHLKRKHSGKEQEARRPLSEEEELQAALEASMRGVGTGTSNGGGASSVEEQRQGGAAVAEVATAAPPAEQPPSSSAAAAAEAAVAATPASRPPEELQAEALASLGPEPEASDPQSCRVGFRLPDGSRTQRRFPTEAPVEMLHAFCRSRQPEAAAGREFYLCEQFPGAPELSDLSSSLSAARLANAMVVMKWR